MKNLLLSPMLLALALTGGTGFSYGQVKDGINSNAVVANEKQMVDTGDSPIRIEKRIGFFGGNVVTRVELTNENRVGYRLHNDAEKAVTAYALILINGNEKSVRMAAYPERPVAANKELGEGYLLSIAEEPLWAFDWILFADGSTWGPDVHGRSKEILAYLNGRKTAVERASELLGYVETNPIMRWIRGLELRSWSMAISPSPVGNRDEDQFRAGYDFVIQQLIGDSQYYKRDLSRQIAERLKEMQTEGSKDQ